MKRSEPTPKTKLWTPNDRAFQMLVHLYYCRWLLTSQLHRYVVAPHDASITRIYAKKLVDTGFTRVGAYEKENYYTLHGKGLEQVVQALSIPANDIHLSTLPEKGVYDYHDVMLNEIRLQITEVVAALHGEIKNYYDTKGITKLLVPDTFQVNKKDAHLEPDQYFELVIESYGASVFGFLEFETLHKWHGLPTPYRPNALQFAEKVIKYVAYLSTDLYFRRFQVRELRIFFILEGGEQRLQNFVTTAEAFGAKRRFWFTTLERLQDRNILTDPIWTRASAEGRRAILEREEE